MKTIYRYTSTNLDGTKYENSLEADDKLVDGVAQAIAAATDAYVAGIDAKMRAAQVKMEAIKNLGAVASALVQMYGGGSAAAPASVSDPLENRSVESLILNTLLDDRKRGISQDQKDKVFGTWTADGVNIDEGILTKSQVPVIVDVMNEKSSPQVLDALVDGDDLITDVQFQQIKKALGDDFIKFMPFVMILRERKDALESRKQAEAEAKERANYTPEPSRKIELEGARIAYEAMSQDLVRPGHVGSVYPGVKVPYPGPAGEGWPGLPETASYSIAVETDFKPEKIIISPGFELVAAFGGAQNFMPYSPGTIAIPAEHLASDAPQPNFPLVEKGWIITLQAKNVSGKQLALWGRVEGREVEKAHDAPCTRCTKCGYLLSLPFTHKVQEACIEGEHAWKDFPNGETEADLKLAAESIAKMKNKENA